MLDVFYSPAYVGAGYAFETTRKAQWIADSLATAPIDGIRLVEPASLTFDDVVCVHDCDYVSAVRDGTPRELAQSQNFEWDEGLWRMVLSSNGGAVAAARTALERGVAGSLSSGLHHARHDRGVGFCTFNGLVLAAHAALDAGAARILILDLDAHCGGGTASLIADDSRMWQLDVSVAPFDRYPSTERAALRMVRDAASYLPTIESTLHELEVGAPPFSLCIYNAGMDPCETCDTGGLHGITPAILDARERMVVEWCRSRALPLAFVLAGGYLGARLGKSGIVDLHRLTLTAAAAGESCIRPAGRAAHSP